MPKKLVSDELWSQVEPLLPKQQSFALVESFFLEQNPDFSLKNELAPFIKKGK